MAMFNDPSPHALLRSGRNGDTAPAMPRKRTLKLPPIDFGTETPGQRLARLRKERGFTQVQLAEQVGIIQSLVSDYETDRLKLSAEMVVRFAMALDVSTDDLLHPEAKKKKAANSPWCK